MKSFKEKVFEYLVKVPKGKVVTYGKIAKAVGAPKAARAVGNALHANVDFINIPCYKVVNAKGKLSKSYAGGGIDVQKERLTSEGVEVAGYTVDLEKFGYKF